MDIFDFIVMFSFENTDRKRSDSTGIEISESELL